LQKDFLKVKKNLKNGKKNHNPNNESVHWRVQCDGCNAFPIVGNRFKCEGCEDFDFCSKCHEKLKQFHPKEHSFKLIEKPACHWRRKHFDDNNEEKFERCKEWRGRRCGEWKEKFNKNCNPNNDPVHWKVQCDGCNALPIVGNRFKCESCENFDFCSKCYENLKQSHPQDHSFKLIERPVCHWGRRNFEDKKVDEKKVEKVEEKKVEEKKNSREKS